MLRKALAILGMLLTLPGLGLGAGFLRDWVQLRSGHGYSVGFDYGSEALLFLIWGGVTLVCLVGAMLSKKTGGAILLLAGWALLLLFAIALPSRNTQPLYHARVASRVKLRDVQHALNAWTTVHGHFPGSQAELEAAVKQGEAPGVGEVASPFLGDGARLPFRLVHIAGARGPVLTPPPAAGPGTVLCATDQELNHYWLTATGLASPVNGAVIIEVAWESPQQGAALLEGAAQGTPAPQRPPARRD